MAIQCIECGGNIDTGNYKDDEREHELDTSRQGELHITVAVRQRFRQTGGIGRLHIDCFERVFDVDVDRPEWVEDD